MKLYEITFITRDEGDPGVAAAIENAAGHITSERTMGRRQFTHPLGTETAGYYTTFRFNIPAEELAEFNRVLSLNPGIIRFLIVVVPDLVLAATDLEEGADLKEAKDLEATATPTATPVADEAKPAVSAEEHDKQLQEQLDKLLGDEQTEETK